MIRKRLIELETKLNALDENVVKIYVQPPVSWSVDYNSKTDSIVFMKTVFGTGIEVPWKLSDAELRVLDVHLNESVKSAYSGLISFFRIPQGKLATLLLASRSVVTRRCAHIPERALDSLWKLSELSFIEGLVDYTISNISGFDGTWMRNMIDSESAEIIFPWFSGYSNEDILYDMVLLSHVVKEIDSVAWVLCICEKKLNSMTTAIERGLLKEIIHNLKGSGIDGEIPSIISVVVGASYGNSKQLCEIATGIMNRLVRCDVVELYGLRKTVHFNKDLMKLIDDSIEEVNI